MKGERYYSNKTQSTYIDQEDCCKHLWFNSYALGPICYYRDKTRVHMVYFFNNQHNHTFFPVL